MSTARQRAAAHIDATIAAGHSIVLHRARFRDGSDGFLTMWSTGPKGELPPATAALADTFDMDKKREREALVRELIRRGLVE